ncbi:MAG: MFS transporter, partial [Acidobacteria bacterium]|nr:MFS transporter [Acidobacteriota bacterium]
MKFPGLRWLMISLIFLATVINYIDRQTVSVLKTAISTDLGLSNSDYAAVQNSFLVLYGISQMLSGWLYDRIGTRLGFMFSIVVWSGAAMAHAFARTAGQFQIFRAVLGFGEAGNWPGAAKLVGEWFPVKERALGMGIFNTGAALGGAVSPPIIAWLALRYGWRFTFVVTGVLGFAWLLLWI